MDNSPIKEEPEWNSHMLRPLEHVETRSPSPKSDAFDVRNPSAASSSAQSTSDRRDSGSSNGRRSRPSVTAMQSQLPAVREMKQQREQQREQQRDQQDPREQRALSEDSTLTLDTVRDRGSIAANVSSKEKVVSSRDVCTMHSSLG